MPGTSGFRSNYALLGLIYCTWLPFNPIEMVEISMDTNIVLYTLEMQVLNCNAWKFNGICVHQKKGEEKNLDLVWLGLTYSSIKQPMTRAFLFKSISKTYILSGCKQMTQQKNTQDEGLEKRSSLLTAYFSCSFSFCVHPHTRICLISQSDGACVRQQGAQKASHQLRYWSTGYSHWQDALLFMHTHKRGA